LQKNVPTKPTEFATMDRTCEYICKFTVSGIAASLVDCRTQFVHAAAENIELEFFQIDFFETTFVRQIVLDTILLPGEFSIQVLGKVALTAPPNMQNCF
jgi:hypothetical protein